LKGKKRIREGGKGVESRANISPSYLDILKIKREERRIKILPFLFDCMIERRGKQFCIIKKNDKYY
jgi:hypothetical protein